MKESVPSEDTQQQTAQEVSTTSPRSSRQQSISPASQIDEWASNPSTNPTVQRVQQWQTIANESPRVQQAAQRQAQADRYVLAQRQAATAPKGEEGDPVYKAINWGALQRGEAFQVKAGETSIYGISRAHGWSEAYGPAVTAHIIQHLRDRYGTTTPPKMTDALNFKEGEWITVPHFEQYRTYMAQRAEMGDALIQPFYTQHLAQLAPQEKEMPKKEAPQKNQQKEKTALKGNVGGYTKGDHVGTLHVAWTFDDGPTAETDDMEQTMGGDRATWYVVRRNIMENKEANLKALKAKQDAGGEIAIHSPHPTEDHINWFKTRGKPHYSYPGYSDIGTAIADLKFFKKILDDKGIKTSFVRVPGGMVSELTEYAAFLGVDHSEKKYDGKKTAAMYLAYKIIEGQSYTTIRKKLGENRTNEKAYEKILSDYQSLKTALNSMDLLSWGGSLEPTKIKAQSWNAEVSGTGLSNTAKKRSQSAMNKIANGGKDRSMIILAHDTRPNPKYDKKPKALNIAAVEQAKTDMEDYAEGKEVLIKYHTMSSLFKEVTGKEVDELQLD